MPDTAARPLRCARFRAVLAGALAALALVTLAPPPAAGAGGLDRFQHGGRATAQAGAMTARADDASAVHYNPAAIVQLEGWNLQGGLDFNNATDEYASPTDTNRANHTIQFPPEVYLTYKPDKSSSFAYGIGLDTPVWYKVDWNSALFPGRFLTRTQELRLFELHPVVSYAVDERWSVGGGLRYLTGSLENGFNEKVEFFPGGMLTAEGFPVRFETLYGVKADVSALTFDLAVHYDGDVWGWGAVFRGPADLDEGSDVSATVRDLTDPNEAATAAALAAAGSAAQTFELPWELRGGFWFSPYPELQVEIDASFQAWSSLDSTEVSFERELSGDRVVQRIQRNWDDTISLRVGAEGEISDAWSIGGGLAWEPSPVPASSLEPGFPRGDAIVYAVGASYELPEIAFDIGYSFHDFDDVGAIDQELENPGVRGAYSARDSVWSVSARWSF